MIGTYSNNLLLCFRSQNKLGYFKQRNHFIASLLLNSKTPSVTFTK